MENNKKSISIYGKYFLENFLKFFKVFNISSSSISLNQLKEIKSLSKMNSDQQKRFEILKNESCSLFEEVKYIHLDRKVNEKIYLELRYKEYMNKLQKGEHTDSVIQGLYDRVGDIRNKTDVKNVWVTVNPKESDSILFDLNNGIEKLKLKKYTETLIWSFEQRGEDDDNIGKGIHLHFLLSFSMETRYDNVKRSIHTIFDKLVGTPSLHVCIKPCYDRWVEDKVNYLKGEKWDEEKDDKIRIDTLWRQKVGLEPYYIFRTG